MSAKHVMISQSKALCGRQVTQGGGADCKNCARVSDANSRKVAAMVPSGNGLVCICDDVWADTSKVEPGTRVVCPVDGTTFEREAAPVGVEGPTEEQVNAEHDALMDEYVRPKTVKPVTFDDVKEVNGWMSTDVDAVTRTLPAGTEVKPGFWNCCQSKPAVAVRFTSEETGEHVYRQGCRSCASTVPAELLAKLPEAPACVVLTGEQIMALVGSVRVMGYRTAANSDGRMSLARNFRPTVKGFNADYGYQCKTWADVRAVLIAAGVKGVKP